MTGPDATTVFVTHDQSEAMSMADRIVIMKDGEVIQIGTPEDVYDRSANLFVADFIGTPPTNFIKITIVAEGDKIYLENAHMKFPLSGGETARLMITQTRSDSWCSAREYLADIRIGGSLLG